MPEQVSSHRKQVVPNLRPQRRIIRPHQVEGRQQAKDTASVLVASERALAVITFPVIPRDWAVGFFVPDRPLVLLPRGNALGKGIAEQDSRLGVEGRRIK